jgi:multidrug efflux pump subunit AcrA (membrane-fusion protein)
MGRFPSPGHVDAEPMASHGYPAGPEAGYASTRFPAMPVTQEGRSRRVWLIAAPVVAAAAGIAILIAFTASGDDEKRSSKTAAGAERVALDGGVTGSGAAAASSGSAGSGAGTGAVAGDPGTPVVPALSPSLAPGAAEVRIGRIEHPVVAVVVASTDGAVERIHVKAGGSVTTGQKLYSLRAGKGVRSSEAIVISPAAGRIERRAARGDRVAKGDVLAQLVDSDRWLVIADLRSDQVTTGWSCTIATSEGRNRAPCRVESVQRLSGEQSRATVTVATDQAAWLQGGEQALLLRLIPPGAPEDPPTPTEGSSAPVRAPDRAGSPKVPDRSAKDAASASTDRRGPDAGP